MRETQILRGLHKARHTRSFAGGLVPEDGKSYEDVYGKQPPIVIPKPPSMWDVAAGLARKAIAPAAPAPVQVAPAPVQVAPSLTSQQRIQLNTERLKAEGGTWGGTPQPTAPASAPAPKRSNGLSMGTNRALMELDKSYAGGMVPMNTAPMSEQDRNAFNNLQDTPMVPMVPTANTEASPPGTKRQRVVSGADMLNSYQPLAIPQLSRGTAYLNGPGTGTSDSIHGVSLSKGEAVLPAKTVQKVGAENIARLIEETNGKPPARGGLRAGGGYAGGKVDWENVTGTIDPDATLGSQSAQSASPKSGFDARQPGAAPQAAAPQAAAPQAAAVPEMSADAQKLRAEADARARARAEARGTTTGATPGPTPVQTPVQTPQSRAGGMWDGVKNMFSSEPKAPDAPMTAESYKAKYNPDINMRASLEGGAKTATKLINGAGKVLKPVGAVMDAADVVDVATDDRMGGLDVANEVASKGAKWASAGALGTKAALIGFGLAGPLGAAVGGLGGGVAGYVGADKLIEGGRALANYFGAGTETSDPSERSYGMVSKALGDKDPYAATASAARDGMNALANPNQKAATAERTGLKLASRQSLPMRQDPRLLNADAARPELGQSRDFTNELSGRPGGRMPGLPAGLREGVIYKTIDAQGRVTYSGRNVGQRADGSAQIVDGMGRDLKMRGSVEVAAPGSMAMGANGSYAFTPAATTAEGRAAQKQEWEARTAKPVQDPAAKLQADYDYILNTPMSRGKRSAMMQGLQARMTQQTAAETNAINREHNQLMAQGTMARLGFDKKKYGNELQQAAAKAESDDAKLSPFATEVDPKTGERKVSEAAANDLRQFRRANAGRMTTPDGKPVDMVQLRATNPTEHARMTTAQDSAFGLGRLFNKYAKDTTFGAQTGWGMPKISDMREADISDWTKGMSLKDAALAPFKPGYYSQGVEIDLGGRKQMVPIGEILNDEQNGGQYRKMLNEWLVANGLPMLGNAVTGE